MRAAFQVDVAEAPQRLQRLANGRAAKRATEDRAGVQQGKRAVGALLAEDRRRRAALRREQLEAAARARGHADLSSKVEATVELSHAEFGALLGLKADAARASAQPTTGPGSRRHPIARYAASPCASRARSWPRAAARPGR